MKTWWLELNMREQRLIASLGTVFFILYSLIWQPLHENLDKGQRKLIRQQALLTWVNQETARYKAVKGNGAGKVSTDSLSSIINSSAKRSNISITRVQPQSKDVQVWIDSIAFDQLLVWLEYLSNNESVEVKSIDLTQGEQVGQVRVKRLQLGKY